MLMMNAFQNSKPRLYVTSKRSLLHCLRSTTGTFIKMVRLSPSIYSKNTNPNTQTTFWPSRSNLHAVNHVLRWDFIPGSIAAEVLCMKFISIVEAASLAHGHVDIFWWTLDVGKKRKWLSTVSSEKSKSHSVEKRNQSKLKDVRVNRWFCNVDATSSCIQRKCGGRNGTNIELVALYWLQIWLSHTVKCWVTTFFITSLSVPFPCILILNKTKKLCSVKDFTVTAKN